MVAWAMRSCPGAGGWNVGREEVEEDTLAFNGVEDVEGIAEGTAGENCCHRRYYCFQPVWHSDVGDWWGY